LSQTLYTLQIKRKLWLVMVFIHYALFSDELYVHPLPKLNNAL